MLRMCFYMHLVPRKIPRLCSEMLNPNITGVTAPVPDIFGNISGAFSLGNYLYKTISDGTHFSMYDMKFTASASNSTYSGSSVQPKALQILIIIKIWNAAGWTVADLE